MFVGSWHFVNLGTMSWGFVRWFKESLCTCATRSAVKVAGETLPSVAKVSGRKSHGFKTDEDGSCAFMCFHVLSCAFMCFASWLDVWEKQVEWRNDLIKTWNLQSNTKPTIYNFLGNQDGSLFYGSTVLPSLFVFLDWKSSRSFHPWSPRMWGWQMSPASFWKTFWLARYKASWRRVAPVSGSKPVVQMEKRRKKVKASWNQVEKLWKEKVTFHMKWQTGRLSNFLKATWSTCTEHTAVAAFTLQDVLLDEPMNPVGIIVTSHSFWPQRPNIESCRIVSNRVES